MGEPLRADLTDDDDVWYTRRRVAKLYLLMPYYTERAPKLHVFDDIVLPSGAYRNPNEWWWSVCGDLLWALDRISETGRALIEMCAMAVPPLTQAEAGRRLGLSQASASRYLDRAYWDVAQVLNGRPLDDDE